MDAETIRAAVVCDEPAAGESIEPQPWRDSPESAQRVVKNLNDAVFATDEHGRVTYISPAISRIAGIAPEEVVGRLVSELLYPDDLPALHEDFARLSQGQASRAEYRIGHRSGDIHWVLASSRPLFENAEFRGITGVLTDITKAKAAEQALQESEARYRQLVEMSPDMIAVIASDRFVFVNDAGLRMLRAKSLDDVIGKPASDRVAPESRGRAMERFAEILAGGDPSERVEQRLLRMDGTSLDVEANARLVTYQGKPAIHVVLRDETERKRIEQERRRIHEILEQSVAARTAELERVVRELEAFSYSVSHDLRVPLRVIEGFSRLFLDDFGAEVNDTARGYIERVHSTSIRMGALIRDLLALSRVTRVAMRPATIDLAAVARDVAADLRQSAPERKVEFKIADKATAEGDPALLRVVLENLLGNAWKYTGKHEKARVEFGVKLADGERVYFVIDDGAGFDMSFAGRLFGAFERLHRDSDFDGTGIGLATVQRIIERHGGRVWAEGAVERGAAFYFTLRPTPLFAFD